MLDRYHEKTANAETTEAFQDLGFKRDAHIRRPGGADVPMRDLPAFLRVLLVTDGTVTKILEAYFWEPVEVATLHQEFVHAEHPIPRLGLVPGDRVLVRRAHLGGVDSGRTYATAFSIIRTSLIPETFRQRLIDRQVGIGVLIRDSGMESYREVLEVGIKPEGTCDDPAVSEDVAKSGDGLLRYPLSGQGELAFRTYRVIVDGEPVILITERFPLNLYTDDRFEGPVQDSSGSEHE